LWSSGLALAHFGEGSGVIDAVTAAGGVSWSVEGTVGVELIGEAEDGGGEVWVAVGVGGDGSGVGAEGDSGVDIAGAEDEGWPFDDGAVAAFDEVLAFAGGGVMAEELGEDRLVGHARFSLSLLSH
jgi:hypothetical protein